MTLYYVENQEYVAVDPTHIDYYVGMSLPLPGLQIIWIRGFSAQARENWRPVSAIQKFQATRLKELRFEFDKVETYALRLRFEGLASPLALTNCKVHAKKWKV